MKNKFKFLFPCFLLAISCFNNNIDKINETKNEIKESSNIRSFEFVSIDSAYIRKYVLSSSIEDLRKLLLLASEKHYEKPLFIDLYRAKSLEIKEYYHPISTIYEEYKIYYFTNNADEKIELLLAVFSNNGKIMDQYILYEKYDWEEQYELTSSMKNSFITSNYKMEVTNYEDNENSPQTESKNGSYNQYFIDPQTNLLKEVFEKSTHIKKEWGSQKTYQSISTTDNAKSYEYFIEGDISNNFKEGHWIEKRYVSEYNKSVITEGNYSQGVKVGEWSYSPNGPADKIEVYEHGILKSTYYP